MILLHNFQHLPDFSQGSVVAPGNFDGIHLGHQALLRHLKQKAQSLQLPLVVLLFEPQPAEFFYKEKAPSRLSSLREKIAFLATCEVDYVFCLKFNAQLAKTSAETFAENYFFKGLHAKSIVIGQDFRFGYQRKGDAALLQTLAHKRGAELCVFANFTLGNERISSTQIREALAHSDFQRAAALLGRDYGLCARVIHGEGRGRQWGIPTANMLLQRHRLPLKGVFCVKVQYGNNLVNGVANIGSRPTVDGTKTVLEIHLLDFNQSLYGERLNVFFLHKLRDEVKFTSVDALIAQIKSDIQKTIDYFKASTYHYG